MPESTETGIFVLETPGGEDAITPRRDAITAFVGPAPRGPVHCPVAIHGIDDFLKRFGVPGMPSLMGGLLGQFFANGGRQAIVVRVPGAATYGRLVLPGPAGPLVLVAANPGPHERLRAAADHERVGADDYSRFNLVVQRLQSTDRPLVEAQEIHAGVSVDPDDEAWIGDRLRHSALVRLEGEAPGMRPDATSGGAFAGPAYVCAEVERPAAEAITDYDLIGSAADGCGLYALDQVPAVDLVCLLPGSAGADIGPVALFAAERYCRKRHALLLVDPPRHWREPADVQRSQRERGFASASVVTCFPRLEPLADEGTGGSALGMLAGWLAAAEAGGGTGWAAPLRGRARPCIAAERHEIAALARAGVNTLALNAAGQLMLHGHVTLGGPGTTPRAWQSLQLRRRALGMIGDIARGTRWVLSWPPTADAWNQLKRQLSAYLAAAGQAGLLAGNLPGQGFCLQPGGETGGEPLSFVVGFALQSPGEFIPVRFRHGVGGCEVTEPAWQSGMALTG